MLEINSYDVKWRKKFKGFKYKGYVDAPNNGVIMDSDVHQLIMKHSRLIDRLIPERMVEMSLIGQCVLFGTYENIDPEDLSWKFYGKHSLENKKGAWD